MGSGYTRSPKLVKGALIEFSTRFLYPVPNVIVFQYNPESLSRTLDVYNPPTREDGSSNSSKNVAGNAQPFDPAESFTLNLELDATDSMETQDPIAMAAGITDRISALEMLLYPTEETLLGELVQPPSFGLAPKGPPKVPNITTKPQRGTVPLVLFVWGPGRILPVRLTSFQVDEQAFSPILYPTRAKATVGLKVLTRTDLSSYKDSAPKYVALAALTMSRKQKTLWAALNSENTMQALVDLLPTP